MGPTTSQTHPRHVHIDYSDPAVRNMLVVHSGTLTWPNPQPYSPPPVIAEPKTPKLSELKNNTQNDKNNAAMVITLLTAILITVGALSPDEQFTGLVTVFALSSFAGQQVRIIISSLESVLVIRNRLFGVSTQPCTHRSWQ